MEKVDSQRELVTHIKKMTINIYWAHHEEEKTGVYCDNGKIGGEDGLEETKGVDASRLGIITWRNIRSRNDWWYMK